MGWYYTVTEEMVEQLGLRGADLAVFAVIAGYSQQQDGCWFGGKSELARRAGVTRETLNDVLVRLVRRGLINSTPIVFRGNASFAFARVAEVSEIRHGGVGNPTGGVGNPTPIDVDRNKNKSSLSNAREKFVKPTIEEVAAYCAAKGLDVDAQRFVDHYTSNGWKVGSAPMKDWQAAARNWAARHAEERQQRQPAPADKAGSQSVAAHNRQVAQRLLGNDFQI